MNFAETCIEASGINTSGTANVLNFAEICFEISGLSNPGTANVSNFAELCSKFQATVIQEQPMF